MIEQFLFTRKIGDRSFSVLVPCDGWNDANAVAAMNGWTVDGSNVHTIPCVPIFQFMTFCQTLAEGDRIQWKPYAEEQIEAFLTAGWTEEPDEQP